MITWLIKFFAVTVFGLCFQITKLCNIMHGSWYENNPNDDFWNKNPKLTPAVPER